MTDIPSEGNQMNVTKNQALEALADLERIGGRSDNVGDLVNIIETYIGQQTLGCVCGRDRPCGGPHDCAMV
jgi:hypothetical protein